MAKKNRKKNSWPINIIRYSVVLTFVCFLFVFLYKSGISFLQNTEMFKVKEVIYSPSLGYIDANQLDRYKGKSLFEISLKDIQTRLQREYPDMDSLRVVMVFPNRLVIQAQKREPFMVIENNDKDIVVDKFGIVIQAIARNPLDLPKARGIKAYVQKGVLKPYPDRDVKYAIKIVESVMKNPYLNAYSVESVNMAQRSKIELYLRHGMLNLKPLFVLLDHEDIAQKIHKLGILLSQGDLELQDVKYIDLRFREPILSKK